MAGNARRDDRSGDVGKTKSCALMYYTHFVSDVVTGQVNKLARELPADFEMFAFGCCPAATSLDALNSNLVQTRAYTRDMLRTLPYDSKLASVDWTTMLSSADLAILRFFRDRPDFEYYWIIEFDVRYTGDWRTIFRDLARSDADLLCAHVRTFEQGSDWMHWGSFSTGGAALNREDLLRGFLPFCRVSNKLMRAIDDRCQRGWTGHYEALWPTICKAIGGRIEEIGGVGPAVPAERVGKYYHSAEPMAGLFLSNFCAWPAFKASNDFMAVSPPDMLWHPVKE